MTLAKHTTNCWFFFTNNKLLFVAYNIDDWSNYSLFGWLVAGAWCWFVLREEYCWLVAGWLLVAGLL
jgi:hypothetical protein